MSDPRSPSGELPEAGSAGGIHLREGSYAGAGGLPAHPSYLEGALYCIFPRVFSEEGTLRALLPELDRIRDLGAAAIWLLPVHPIGEVNRKGKHGSPYAIRDYRAVHPDLGTEEDLRRLAGAAHERGLRVLLDYVANHAAPDNVAFAAHPEWMARNGSGEPVCRMGDWWDVADLRHDAALEEYLVESAARWVGEFGIDGFRCDVAGMVPRSFWRALRRRLAEVHPDHLLLAEWQDPALHRAAFHASYDWLFYRTLKDVALGRRPASAVGGALRTWEESFPAEAVPLRFLENHDEPRATAVFGRERTPAFAAVAFLSGGWPLLYNGQEAGTIRRPSLFEREPIDWSGRGRFEGLYRDLLRRYRSRDFWGRGRVEPLATDRPVEVAAFRRRGPDGEGAVVANLSRDAVAVTVEGGLEGLSSAAGVPAPTKQLRLEPGEAWIGERVS